MGNPGRHFTNRSETVGPGHLLIVKLFQFTLRLGQIDHHGIEVEHQNANFIVVLGFHPDRQVTLFNQSHFGSHLLNRPLDEPDHQE